MFRPVNKKFIKDRRKRSGSSFNSSGKSRDVRDYHFFGDFLIFSKTYGQISADQLQVINRIIQYEMKKQGKCWVLFFPQKSITKKGLGVRIGKGKGAVNKWYFPVKVGDRLFEFSSISEMSIKKIFMKIQPKMSVKIGFKKTYKCFIK